MGECETNCKSLWIKALYKCNPFTIYLSLCAMDPPACAVGSPLWLWAFQNLYSLRALHITSAKNVGADLMSCGGPRRNEWRSHPDIVTDLAEVRDGSEGPVRIQRNHPLQDVVLSPLTRSSPRGRCDGAHSVAADALVCVPAAAVDPPSSGEDPTRETVAHSAGPGELISPVVPRAGIALMCGAMAASKQARCTVASPRMAPVF